MTQFIKYEDISSLRLDIDWANSNSIISPVSDKGKEFNKFMSEIMDKLCSGNLEQKAYWSSRKVNFYLQDNNEPNPAKIVSTEHRTDQSDLSGDSFAVVFNKKYLDKMTSKDQIAYILGHELTHVLYDSADCGVRDLHSDKETVCDINSMKLMSKSGFDVTESLTIEDMYSSRSFEQMRRIEERKKALPSLRNYTTATPYDASVFNLASYDIISHDFEIPTSKDSEEEQIEKTIRNLKKVSEFTDGDGFSRMMKPFLEEKGSEQASKFMINLTARAIDEFPPIDEVKKNEKYRKYLNHPIFSLSDSTYYVGNMKGNKLLPPASLVKVQKYFRENEISYKAIEAIWKPLLKPVNPALEKYKLVRE